MKLALGAAEDAFGRVVGGVPWERVLGAAEDAFGEMVGFCKGRVLGAAEGGDWWGGRGAMGGGCWEPRRAELSGMITPPAAGQMEKKEA